MSDADTSLTRLGMLDTTLLSDALDAMGLPGGTGAIRAQTQPAQLHGRVRTVELGPLVQCQAHGPHIATAAVANAQPGDVIVVANHGRTDVSCWGGLLSLGSQQRGVRGVIADGLCRDIAEARDLQFPVFSRGATPRTARNRLQQVASGVPIIVDGIPVDDGDYVLGDDCGVVFIPQDRIDDVLTRAEWARDREAAIAADIRRGIAIDEAMHDARLTSTADRAAALIDGDTMTLNTIRWQKLAGLPTPTISDALDKLGLPGALDGPAPVTRTGTAVCGPAFTVGYERIGAQSGTVGDFLDDVPSEAVIVIDNEGRTDCTVWGAIMTRVAHHRGIAATVINGACRDTAEATTIAYPIWARGTFMRTGKDRVRLAGVNVPVTIGSVVIQPGDIVCADADGVVVVPADRATEVAEIARHIEDIENRIIASVLAGTTLAQARSLHGYHTLQTPAGDDSPTP